MSDLHELFVESQLDLLAEMRRKHDDAPRLTLAEESPAHDRMLQFFQYDHLPEPLQAASRPFCQLARMVVDKWPQNPERTVCLRKLLEAKDAAVRTLLYQG